MKTYFDDLGRELTFEKTPKRIISLVPSISELLYDLNLEERLIGITKFCVHPAHFKHTITQVGGTKKVKIDKIKELAPEIVLCNKEENTPEIVEELSKFTQVYVCDIKSINDSKRYITNLGYILNRRTESNLLNQKIDLKLAEFNNYIVGKEEITCSYMIWSNPWMAAGNNTFINSLLELNKFKNIYSNKEELYPEIELKKIRLEGDPEVVFLSSEPFPFKDEHAFELGRFTHHAKVVFVDGEMFSWFGSRLLKAFDYFKQVRERIEL